MTWDTPGAARSALRRDYGNRWLRAPDEFVSHTTEHETAEATIATTGYGYQIDAFWFPDIELARSPAEQRLQGLVHQYQLHLAPGTPRNGKRQWNRVLCSG